MSRAHYSTLLNSFPTLPGIISTKVVTLATPDPGPGEVLINLCVYFCCLLPVLIVLILQDTLWSMSLGLRSHDSCGS
jgi:hypothetical protein